MIGQKTIRVLSKSAFLKRGGIGNRGIPPHGPAVTDWIDRGGTGDNVILTAYYEFDKAVESIRSKILRINMLAASTFPAVFVPFYNGNGITQLGGFADTNVNFVAGDYTLTGGLLGNGTTKTIDTGFVTNSITEFGLADGGMGMDAFNINPAGNGSIIGTHNDSNNGILPNFGASSALVGINQGTWEIPAVQTDGFLYVSRTGSNEIKFYKNGTLVHTGTTITSIKDTASIKVFHGASTRFSGGSFGYVITTGLVGAEVTILNNAWNTFKTSIGR